MFIDAQLSLPSLSVTNLRLTHPASGRLLVEGLSLRLELGRTLALIGESGSGKTLTAMALAGLLPHGIAAEGHLHLGTEEVDLAKGHIDRARRNSAMGVVFQNPASVLNPRLTVREHLIEALSDQDRGRQVQTDARCIALLEEVGIHDAATKLQALPHQLSGGQAQRVVIALAMARRPSIIIADEPTTALDATVQARILDLLDDLQRRHGFSILLITHDMAIVHDRADYVMVMHGGRLVEEGPNPGIIHHPQEPVTRALLQGSGLAMPETRYVDASRPVEPLLRTKDLRKTFCTGTTALKGVDLDISAGEAVGIVGESGSGKTTLARIIAGLETPSSGDLSFAAGQTFSNRAGRKPRVGYIFQDPWTSISPHLSLLQTVAEPLLAQGMSQFQAKVLAAETLAEVGLPPESWNAAPTTLSGGQRQRVGIARAVIQSPDLLIADEPVAALDANNKARVLELLAAMRRKRQLTMLLISHDLQIVQQLCSRTIVMARGAILEDGPTHEVLAAPRHPYTRDLLAAVPGRNPRQHRPLNIES